MYSVDGDELRKSPTPAGFDSGIRTLDSAMPLIRAGSVCAIVGMRGVGVTELALTYVRRVIGASNRSSPAVVVMNGHLPGDVLARRLTSRPGEEQPSVAVASWLSLPVRQADGRWNWVDSTVSLADFIVYDTLDESFPAVRGKVRRIERVWVLRDLRDAARESSKAVIATCRIAPVSPRLVDVREAWRRHPMHEAIMDASDVVITVVDAVEPAHVRLVVEDRLGPNRTILLRMDPAAGMLGSPI